MSNLPFGFAQADDSPGFLLWKTTTLWQRLIKKNLEKQNLSHAQFVIMAGLLWASLKNVTATQIMIVRHTKLDKMTVSKSLKKLVHDGLVSRVESEQDSRAKNVALTPQGKKLVTMLVPIIEQIDAIFFGKLGPQDEQQLKKLLQKLTIDNEAL